MRREKVEQTALEIHSVLNSQIFRDKVLVMQKHGERSAWRNKSNKEIYDFIMKGSERLSPEVDYEMDVFIDDYYSIKRVIGYTNGKTPYIFTNTRYFDKNHTREVGANIVHEWSHKLGFDHDFRATAARPYSVSYRLGKIYQECYDIIFKKQLAAIIDGDTVVMATA